MYVMCRITSEIPGCLYDPETCKDNEHQEMEGNANIVDEREEEDVAAPVP